MLVLCKIVFWVFALFQISIYGYFISNYLTEVLKDIFYTSICIIFNKGIELFNSSINKSKEIEFSQLTVISKLIKKEKKELNIVISTERSLQPHLINKNLFIENKLDLQKGVQIEIQELANKLTLLGYTKDNVTSTEGFWSRRGEIIDIYPVNNEFPIRLEFFDNIIEKIREYDPIHRKH